ncbi:uncharacterized protein PAC_00336 [Phialocephala subalpina]|uniref:Uncharacterized protein n=1 Tax=Phialocephala subalpina TaxID=576137 RepID=A0A1L7WCE9_9HELO|nr:uncharacterized protein PAC_00336 [Phialocephala subalpina]
MASTNNPNNPNIPIPPPPNALVAPFAQALIQGQIRAAQLRADILRAGSEASERQANDLHEVSQRRADELHYAQLENLKGPNAANDTTREASEAAKRAAENPSAPPAPAPVRMDVDDNIYEASGHLT